MIREILNTKDARLRLPSRDVSEIDKKITEIIRDLKDTLLVQKDPEGVGLAAPQIGKNLKIFVIMPETKISVFINPTITKIVTETPKLKRSKNSKKEKSGKNKKIMEGCLSLPNYYGPISRASRISINYMNEKGEQVKESFSGLTAQIIQHEIDHLEGILFVDRLLEQKKPLYEYVDGEWEQVEI